MLIQRFFLTAACVLVLSACGTTQTLSHSKVFPAAQADVYASARTVLEQMNYRRFEGDASSGKLTAFTDVDPIATASRWRTADVQVTSRDGERTEVTILIRDYFEELRPGATPQTAGIPRPQGDGSYGAFFELLGTALGVKPVSASAK